MMSELLDLRNKNHKDNEPEKRTNFDLPEKDAKRNMTENPEADIVAWTAPEIHHELISHSLRKFIIVLLFAMALLAVVWQRSFLTAITFAVMGFVTSLHFQKERRHGEYLIHPKGIIANDKIYEYQHMESFCIHHDHDGLKELSLESNKRLIPHIKIPLGDQDPEEVRAALSMYLIEDYHEHGPDDYLRVRLGL